jgi:hypothetical protein
LPQKLDSIKILLFTSRKIKRKIYTNLLVNETEGSVLERKHITRTDRRVGGRKEGMRRKIN